MGATAKVSEFQKERVKKRVQKSVKNSAKRWQKTEENFPALKTQFSRSQTHYLPMTINRLT